MRYYTIEAETKYYVELSGPVPIEEVTNEFVSEDELSYEGRYPRAGVMLRYDVIRKALDELCSKLEKSKKRTIQIKDQDLLDALCHERCEPITELTGGTFSRRKDRLCYPPKPRKKVKPTKGDAKNLIRIAADAVYIEFGTWFPRIALVEYRAGLLLMFKKVFTWKQMRSFIPRHDEKNLKFYKQIWDNPKEYLL